MEIPFSAGYVKSVSLYKHFRGAIVLLGLFVAGKVVGNQTRLVTLAMMSTIQCSLSHQQISHT